MEFLINKKTSRYSTWLSYTLSKNRYRFATFTPANFPNNVDIRHAVSMAINLHVSKNITLSLGSTYKTGRPFTKPVTSQPTVKNGNQYQVNYDLPNHENLPAFIRLDASIKYQFLLLKNIKSSLALGVLNATNRQNTINRYYVVDKEATDTAITIDQKSIGFTPNLSFRTQF